MTQSTAENTKTIPEIQAQIEKLKEATERKKEHLEAYRSKRAEIVVNEADTQKNKARVTSIDCEIKQLQKSIENAPTELALLEENLIAEQNRLAQKARAGLIEQQQEIAEEAEILSKSFIASLEKANNINSNLRAALSAEAGLAQKTGQQVLGNLGNFCHGSAMSLSLLLEVMQSQFAGNHTTPLGSADSNVRIRL